MGMTAYGVRLYVSKNTQYAKVEKLNRLPKSIFNKTKKKNTLILNLRRYCLKARLFI